MHIPVLLKEVIKYLNPQPNQNFIDCTFGSGGHTQAILEKIKPDGKLLAMDANPNILQATSYKLQVKLVNDNFRNLTQIYEHHFPYPVNGILFDLGFSSIELNQSGLGFSFQSDEPLDMRFNPDQQRLTAAEILNKYSLKKIAQVFYEYGEIPHARAKKVALEIVKQRGKQKFERTSDLIDIIGHPCRDALNRVSAKARRKIHPATLFFQALRIEVNDELNALRDSLPQAIKILQPQGRLAVISFHSLEDRIVKHYFKGLAKDNQVAILTKKPITPSDEEIKQNPRARSGKLRVVEKL